MQKLTIIATISFLILAATGCTGGAQGGPSMLLKPDTPTGEVLLGEVNNGSRLVYTYQVGPFDLPAKTSADEMLAKPADFRFNVEEELWLTTFEPKVEDADGNALPGELVHHIILVNHGEENTFCTTKQTGNPFAAATSTMETTELPEGHGYLLLPTDPLEARVVLKNPTGIDYRGVYIKFAISGKAAQDTNHISDVKSLMIDIDPCEHKPTSIAPGEFVEKTATAFSPEAGSVIKAYGLLQNYGVSISLATNESEEPFWQGIAQIDEKYRITGLSPFEDPAGVPVGRGEKLSLTVAYDNVSDEWFDEASGAAMVYLAREEEEDLPSPPQDNGDEEEISEEPVGALSTQKNLLTLIDY